MNRNPAGTANETTAILPYLINQHAFLKIRVMKIY
jgi:hypothetical protein